MVAQVNMGDTQLLAVVRAVLLGLLPPGIEVIRAFGNRVPEPVGSDFCVLSPPHIRTRLSTNRDVDIDRRVTGNIAGDILTVESGFALLPGYGLYGPVVAPGSVVTAALPNPMQYAVAPAQTVPAGSTIYVGRHTMLQPTDMVCQCDVHGPASSMNATAIATTWRDDAGCQLMRAASGPLDMQPLYADDPRMVPFPNAEAQWEDRWIVDLHVQANVLVTLGQEFADQLHVDLLVPDLMLLPLPPPVPLGLEDLSGMWAFDNGAPIGWG